MHYSMWPLRWQAACGAPSASTTGELALVSCAECRGVVVRAEIAGTRLAAPAGR